MSSTEQFNAIVIGAGQAGLASGYYLRQKGDNFIILDQNTQVGESWRKRWDSLRLFTPNFNNHLPGMKIPGGEFDFPTKDDVVNYLESYANKFNLPVRPGVKVDSLQRNEAGYQIISGERSFHARNVIVATGAYHFPRIPYFALNLARGIRQIHSVDYHNPSDTPSENILVVGAGNSGAEIAIELAHTGKKVWLSGRDVGRIPADRLGKFFGGKPFWWFMRHAMTIDTPMGRRMKKAVQINGSPLIRTSREDVINAGVELLPRLVDSQGDVPHITDGRAIAADGIVWATGFQPDYSWIKLPIFDENGRPQHVRGVVPQAHGIYFVGLQFQSGLASSLLGGVDADARYITGKIS